MKRARSRKKVMPKKLEKFQQEIRDQSGKFNRKFLWRTSIERAGMLAKHYRKAQNTERVLANIEKKLEKKKEYITKKELRGETITEDLKNFNLEAERARKFYSSLMRDAQRIFADSYINMAVQERTSKDSYFEVLHECVHSSIEIKNFKRFLDYL